MSNAGKSYNQTEDRFKSALDQQPALDCPVRAASWALEPIAGSLIVRLKTDYDYGVGRRKSTSSLAFKVLPACDIDAHRTSLQLPD